MRISIVCVGKIKENYFVGAIDEYVKRLSKYCKLNIIEVEDEKTPDRASDAEELQIKQKESIRIQKSIKEGSYVIALAIEGEMLSSEKFSQKIDLLKVNGISHLTFIIGGSLGLDQGLLRNANYLLSFSKMTYPHQLMRVILLEQIYRGFRISSGEPYHK